MSFKYVLSALQSGQGPGLAGPGPLLADARLSECSSTGGQQCDLGANGQCITENGTMAIFRRLLCADLAPWLVEEASVHAVQGTRGSDTFLLPDDHHVARCNEQHAASNFTSPWHLMWFITPSFLKYFPSWAPGHPSPLVSFLHHRPLLLCSFLQLPSPLFSL